MKCLLNHLRYHEMGAKEIQDEFEFNESSFPKICTFWTLTSISIKESHETFTVPEDVVLCDSG